MIQANSETALYVEEQLAAVFLHGPKPLTAKGATSLGGVNLIVSCTKRKTRVPRASLRLGGLEGAATVVERARAWIKLLRGERADMVEAASLYSGDHWSVVRAIARAIGGQTVRVWVCSAGYGLVTPSTLLAPYDATFAPGQEDSVVRAGESAREVLPEWWRAVGLWKGPAGVTCRTIASIASDYPDDFLMVALSDGYMKAVVRDLEAAASNLADTERMAIISAGGNVPETLETYLLPCDSRLQPVAGGALASLNVRLAQKLLESSRKDLALSRCRAMFVRWMSSNPQRETPSRTPMSDDQVCAFIRSAIAKEPSKRATPLLKELRQSGRACEHGRFVTLFREVRGGRNART
jgi:hypothetical protein